MLKSARLNQRNVNLLIRAFITISLQFPFCILMVYFKSTLLEQTGYVFIVFHIIEAVECLNEAFLHTRVIHIIPDMLGWRF